VAVSRHADTPSQDGPVTAGSATPYTTPLDVNVIVGALSVFYSEISGFGISLKRRVDEVSQTARAGLQLAEINLQATQRLDETTEDLADYNREATRRPGTAQPGPVYEARPDARLADVRQLAAQYNELRGTMPSGDQRTVLMDQIVQEMRFLLREAQGVDLAELLSSPDRGIRLAAYAYLLEHQDREFLSQLAEAAANEDKPHAQYWALEALRHQVIATPSRCRMMTWPSWYAPPSASALTQAEPGKSTQS